MYIWIKHLCRAWDRFGNVSYTLEGKSAGQFFILFSTKKEIDFFHCTMWNEMVWKSQADRAPWLVLYAYMYTYTYAAIRGTAYINKEGWIQVKVGRECADTRMDLEIIILSEISQVEKVKYLIISLICEIYKNDTNRPVYKTEKDS